MHMGHSHSHHHHHHHNDRHRDPSTTTTTTTTTTTVKKVSSPRGGWGGKLLLLSGRRAVRILFAGLITLLPPILKRAPLARADVGAFVLTAGILSIFDIVRDEARALLTKGESWRVSWLKHSTPLSADYFFRNDNAADQVTFLGIIVNVLLSAGKFAVGVTCHSSALIADAGHSLSDLFSDFVTLWAVQVARLPPDDDHPYGHGKFESVGSLFLSLTLLGTGLSVGASSYVKFLRVIHAQRSMGIAAAAKLVEIPTWPALVMAGASILSKEWLYRITRRVGEELKSQVIIANAWHHRSDAYSSVLAMISIGLAMAVPGFLAADPAAGILVAGMIAMTGAEIMGESVKQLTDAMTDEELVRNVEATASEDADVRRVSRVRARQVGSSALVDVEVEVPPDLSASAMRAIEERIRVRIVSEVNGIVDVDIKATIADVVFCPLLLTIEDSDIEHHISATEVEMAAREILGADPAVRSVQGVTVHYQDTVLVRVDANICIDPKLTG
jgi:cation diffusion facilitator family transporter